MKLWELDWTPGRKYKDIDGDIWRVDSRGRDLEDDEYTSITEYVSHKTLATADFEPIINWSEVEVDTKILVSEDGVKWDKRYFAKYEDEEIYAFNAGKTSWSGSDELLAVWTHAKLAENED